ncbi:hypothetical protein [Flavobacterium sp. LS1P3]|uniref:hypothetical protein n=1 Tax=Flavobacterium sp. LS1P3 TaxID=3401720 RepID=UPI003AADD5E9
MTPIKPYLVILLSIVIQNIAAQDNDRSSYQTQLYKLAIKTSEGGDYLEAIRTFAISNNINPKADVATLALKKADSLKFILRQNKINELIGKWKWIPKEGNWAIREDNLVGKMIHITVEEIQFFELYKNTKEWKLVQTDKNRFSENPESYSFTEFLNSNNEVWDYNIDSNTGELIATYIGEKIENNYTELVCGNQKLNYFKLQ